MTRMGCYNPDPGVSLLSGQWNLGISSPQRDSPPEDPRTPGGRAGFKIDIFLMFRDANLSPFGRIGCFEFKMGHLCDSCRSSEFLNLRGWGVLSHLNSLPARPHPLSNSPACVLFVRVCMLWLRKFT